MTHRKLLGVSILLVLVALAAGVPASAKGTHTLKLDQAVSLKGTQLASGTYNVSWEAHSPDATVTFVKAKDGEVAATAHAKLVDRGVKYDRDSVVCDENPDGSRTLIEIRFAGTKQALVFSEATSTQ